MCGKNNKNELENVMTDDINYIYLFIFCLFLVSFDVRLDSTLPVIPICVCVCVLEMHSCAHSFPVCVYECMCQANASLGASACVCVNNRVD